MSAQIIPITSRLEEVWNDYIAKLKKANDTCHIDGGIAAGRAYRKWLDLFLSEEERKKLGALQ